VGYNCKSALKKNVVLILLFFLTACSNFILAQDMEVRVAFERFEKLYNSGDFVNAEKCLLSAINSGNKISSENLVSFYNNLGAIYTSLGNYSEAQEFYNRAESKIVDRQENSLTLATIFINKGFIYDNLKSFSLSKEYYEKGIRMYIDVVNPDKDLLSYLATAYLNLGIVYYETENFHTALLYLRKSAELIKDNKLTESPFVFLNIAKCLYKLKKITEADKFFHLSLESCYNEFGENYYRLSEIYFGYGLFLQKVGRDTEAIEIHKKALSLNLKNYGEKHTFVALSYKYIGDDYLQQNKLDSALFSYQNSLIAVVTNFNNTDILTNPPIDSSLFDIRLLDNLKSKSKALELYSDQQADQVLKLRILKTGVATIELALQLIDRIRNNYMSEESRIYLAENEKETWIFATQLAYRLYLATHDKSVGYKMYSIVQRAKAAILRNDITGNELLWSVMVPDSLREKQNSLSGNIAAYNKMVLEEGHKSVPDSKKISIWKDALFEMNREKEKVTAEIEMIFPQYHDLIRKTEPIPISEIQKLLKRDESIVDYLLSNKYSGGVRKLYIFLITRNNLDFKELSLDSLFIKNADIIKRTDSPSGVTGAQNDDFSDYTGALNYMYLNLIKPVEPLIKGKKLIIIPDEEIGWLPFDAFIKDKPGRGQTDYEGLHYLIRNYTISYSYSSSLIFRNHRAGEKGAEVFAFSPDYNSKTDSSDKFSSLKSAGAEIGSVLKWFKGKSFLGSNATKANFITSLSYPAILHLAMHSSSDSLNSKYSYFMFDNNNATARETKLYNYEISLIRIKSPMVVLSACNSGTGTLYSGEGLMSLARSFTLAGASSVIKTAWEINDEKSTEIITGFYQNLSKGKDKNVAMRLAKLEYLKNSAPVFTNPYYWAAYEVLGDNAPVARNLSRLVIIILIVVICAAGLSAIYFRRRSIFSERSL
jgi:CHAT domain-containing protein/tetratricopeptide (TPR) repeat protein